MKTASTTLVEGGSLVDYLLQVVVTGVPSRNLVVTDILPAGLSYVAALTTPAPTVTGQTLTWSLGTVDPGTVLIRYQVRVDDFALDGTVLPNQASATGDNAPTGRASAAVTVAGDYQVQIAVYNSAGEVVKVILVEKVSQDVKDVTLSPDPVIQYMGDQVYLVWKGKVIGSWDGTNQSGAPVGNGPYFIKVDNLDAFGVLTSDTLNVSVERSLSGVTVKVYNSAGELVRVLDQTGSMPVDGAAWAKLSTDTIEPNGGAGAGGIPRTLGIELSNGASLVWDGRSDQGAYVTSGEYLVEVHMADGKGGETVVVKSVAVLSVGPGAGNLVVAPNVLTPAHPKADLSISADRSLTLRATVFSVAGEKILSVVGPAGGNHVTLDGTTLSSGFYVVSVELDDGSGRIDRKVTRLIVRK